MEIAKLTKKAKLRKLLKAPRLFNLLEFRVRDEETLSRLKEDPDFNSFIPQELEDNQQMMVTKSVVKQDDGSLLCKIQSNKNTFGKCQVRNLAKTYLLEITGPDNLLVELGKQVWLSNKAKTRRSNLRKQDEGNKENITFPIKEEERSVKTSLNQKRPALLEMDQNVCSSNVQKKVKVLENKLNYILSDLGQMKDLIQKKEAKKKEKSSNQSKVLEEVSSLLRETLEAKETQINLAHQTKQDRLFIEANKKYILGKEAEISQLNSREIQLFEKEKELEEREKMLTTRELTVAKEEMEVRERIKNLKEGVRQSALAQEESMKEMQKFQTQMFNQLKKKQEECQEEFFVQMKAFKSQIDTLSTIYDLSVEFVSKSLNAYANKNQREESSKEKKTFVSSSL